MSIRNVENYLDIKWISPSNITSPDSSELITEIIALFIPDSRRLFNVELIDFSKKLTNEYLNQLKNYLFVEGCCSYTECLFYLLKPDKSYSLYYSKIKLKDKELSFFETKSCNILRTEPKEIILDKSNNLFCVDYFSCENHSNIFKTLKIQETYENYKLNSLLVKVSIRNKILNKYLAIIKLNDKWFIYLDTFGFVNISFEIKKNIISFGKVKFDNFIFNFSKVKECRIFYLKYDERSTKFLNVFADCNCRKDNGWRQIDSMDKRSGVCWFDAGMMALLVPLRSRKLFLKPLSKKYNIPEEFLYPCKETQTTFEKYKMIYKMTRINTKKTSSNFLTVFRTLYNALNKPYNIEEDDYFKDYNIPVFYPRNKLDYLTTFIDPESDIFVITAFKKDDTYPDGIKRKFKNYFLISIYIAIKFSEDSDINHAVSFIKCKQGWFLFDDNLTYAGKKMIPIKTETKGDDIIFKEVKYKYWDQDSPGKTIKIDLLNSTQQISLVYSK